MSALHDRLKQIAGKRSYRALGDLTQQHPETVRRYMQGASPSVEFLTSLCQELGVNANWLLTGIGAEHVATEREHVLREANPGELLTGFAATIENMAERLDRMEIYVQSLEAKLAANSAATPSKAGANKPVNPRAVAIANAVSK